MKFERDGLLCKIAYGWRRKPFFDPEDLEGPINTNICPLFWRTLISLIVVWPLIAVTRLIGWVIRIVGAIPMFVLMGYRPAGREWRLLLTQNEVILPFVPIERWPTYTDKEGEKHRIEIFWVFATIAILGAFAALIGTVAYMVLYLGVWHLVIQGLVAGVILPNPLYTKIFYAALSIIALLIIWAVARDTESFRLVKAFARAKKEKVCPTVVFE